MVPGEAQYCPGCGRPVTAEALARERAANALPLRIEPEEELPEVQPVSFRNREALRSSYWNAAIAAFFGNLIGSPLLTAFWASAAGFFSVFAYLRRTGVALTFEQGCRLGAMTGVMISALTLLMSAIVAISAEDPGARFRELPDQLREQGQAEQADLIASVVSDPAALTTLVLFLLAFVVVLTLALAALGGGIGAKMLGRGNTKQ